jgi:hypothetical protein
MAEKKHEPTQAKKEKAREDPRGRSDDRGPILGPHSIGTAEVVAGVAAA